MIRFSHYIQTIDSHTMGEPTRIITGGAPRILGKTMMEKKLYMESELDWLRKLLMSEPRGHKDMFGAILTEPCDETCDLGVVFMDSKGYLNMCGHGTMGTVTTAINTGIMKPKPVIRLDTPAGVVECKVKIENDTVKEVSLKNVPSFVLYQDIDIDLPEIGKITMDIAFGGSIFGIVDAAQLGLKLMMEEHQQLIYFGKLIMTEANKQVKVAHPLIPQINKIDLVEFSLLSNKPGIHYRNVVVFGNGQIDRSPCGTGTCAKMASLYQKKKLALHVEFVHESIINSTFVGKLLDVQQVGKYQAVIPQITGSAWITGMHQFIIEKDDPYPEGFLIG
ncbi:proline racemase family protein [Microaerobacter geothermalis]|uniref:proline racemase family protein n=1 Tax=Microaerobacter geothermalis TaxID=674972 RepID=UPI001F2CB32A|nr:proline racemase family protein [Microaerobacter geothermalis]MCF6093679.1 proline racemase family protein [Microaerobacter geothermalis]